MTDENDLIRRGDALDCFIGLDGIGDVMDCIAALPPAVAAVQPDEELDALDAKLASQIGDDVAVIFDPEYLFKQSRAAITTLRAQLAEAKADKEKVGRELNLARYGQPDFSWQVHKEALAEANARADRAEAALAALAASQPADPVANAGCRQQVKVKPLVWYENPDIGEGGFIAKGIFDAAYHAMDDGWSYYRRGLWADAASLSAAKAAAQADYDGRILSALEPAPVTLAPDAAKVAALITEAEKAAEAIDMAYDSGDDEKPHRYSEKLRAAIAAMKEERA